MANQIAAILNDLTGHEAPFPKDYDSDVLQLISGSGLGFSQLNELLLLLGYDRVTSRFFQFLLDGSTEYKGGKAFNSIEQLREGVDRFRILAILNFGNVKFGFKYLSSPATDLSDELARTSPIDPAEFSRRHKPLLAIDVIPGEKTYYLGYLIKNELDRRKQANPADEEVIRQLKEREEIVGKGKKNHEAYLASDHMDVYVATSMRERHEYQMVSQVVQSVFNQPKLQELQVRWFDPTQAFCEERIDKGLVEGLMLRRAACTLYLAQETDTLGKDSELASTLAQGKPVIAYLPSVKKEDQSKYVENLLKSVSSGNPGADEKKIVLDQLRVFSPEAAWREQEVMNWNLDNAKMDLTAAKEKLGNIIREHYDKRARTLKESHPLGLQIHLDTGVANGVLVARTTEECAELIRRILTRTLEFNIRENTVEGKRYLMLEEKMTGSVFRVVTGDRFLTNAFWNFYTAK